MKALLNEDVIIKINSFDGIEIGKLPLGVGLERLRWDGSKIIDLADLSEIWVRNKNGSWELHCIQVDNSQLVEMTYADRKKLILNGGSIRLKTEQEIEDERIARLLKVAKAKLSAKMGEITDLHMAMLAFIMALIVYARNQPQALADFFDTLIPHIIDTFPMDRWEDELMDFAKDLKQFLTEYYNEIDNI